MDLYPLGSKRWGKAVLMMGEAMGATWFALTRSSWNAGWNSCSTWLNFLAFLNKTPLEVLENCRMVGSRREPRSRSQYALHAGDHFWSFQQSDGEL